MDNENIFSGLKVVDFSSFIAGPAAAAILADFGADVIKVEPPTGDPQRVLFKVPPHPRAKENYPWHLENRNKRGMALNLKSPDAAKVLERLVKWADVMVVNFPPPTRKKLKLAFEDVAPWNSRLIYADLSGFGDKGPDAELPGFDITAYWARGGLLALTRDAGAPPTVPVSGSGDHATAISLYSAIVTGLYRRERTGKGSYVSTSLLASGIWSAGIVIQGALSNGELFPLHDRKNPPNPTINVYQSSDKSWFLIATEPSKLKVLAISIDHPELITDPRFADLKNLLKNTAQLTAILDEIFSSQPMAHWREVFTKAHIPFSTVQTPMEVVNDPQLHENKIAVPIEGVGDDMKFVISSPLQVHDVNKTPAKRAPEIGEHNEEILKELGFNDKEIADFSSKGAIQKPMDKTNTNQKRATQ